MDEVHLVKVTLTEWEKERPNQYMGAFYEMVLSLATTGNYDDDDGNSNKAEKSATVNIMSK